MVCDAKVPIMLRSLRGKREMDTVGEPLSPWLFARKDIEDGDGREDRSRGYFSCHIWLYDRCAVARAYM